MKTRTFLISLAMLAVVVLVIAQPAPVVRRLRDLIDVKPSVPPSNGDALIYNSTSGLWTNGAASGGGGTLTGTGTNNTLAYWTGSTNLSSIANGVGLLTNNGSGGFGFTTNIAQDITISNITVTNINIVQTQTFNVAKGGHLQVTNITVFTNGTLTFQNLPLPAVLVVLTNGVVTNATLSGITQSADGKTLTASGSSGGASVWVPNTALAYSGSTNLTIDGSGGTNFYVLLTNTAFFATPSNVPASKATNTSFTVYFQQDSTGGRLVTWTNASFKWPGGPTASFQPTTNAGAVSWVSFTMSPFTNGVFISDYGVYDSR